MNKAIAFGERFGVESMVQSAIAAHTERICLSGISWRIYELLLEELGDRRVRLMSNRGDLELVAPSPEYELNKKSA